LASAQPEFKRGIVMDNVKEYRIPETNIADFTTKIDKLNKTANKLGCNPISYTTLRTEDVKHMRGNDFIGYEWDGTYRRYHIITVKGEAPKLNGWSFIATLEHLDNGNIIKSVPGESDLPESFRTSAPICEYCHKDWLHRKETFVLRNEQGELKQVGRQCLADFLGHLSPEQIANFATRLFELSGELDDDERLFDSYPKGYTHFDLLEFLSKTVAVIESRGWVSAKQVRETGEGVTTASEVNNQLLSHDLKPREKIYTEDKHVELAEKAIAWIRTELAPKSDYEHNLVTLTKTDAFPIDNAGLVASLIPVYQREMGKLEAVKTRPEINSQYVGNIGDRIEADVIVTYVHFIENNYGGYYAPQSTAIIKMVDKQGNAYTWFTSTGDMEQGKEYHVKGTVKCHKEYKGIRETVLTRCKVIDR
jgi:hypothetical protein